MDRSDKDQQGGHPWLSWAVLTVLLIVALILRWRYVREISLFVDEFVTAWAARNILNRGMPIFPSGNFYPHGLTFTYLQVPFVLGQFNEIMVRIPGLLVGMLTLPAVYWVGRRLFSDQVGLMAAAAMAVDPECIIWGSRARMYGLLQLVVLLVVYFYFQGLAHDRPRARYLAMGLLVIAMFTHAEAAFLLPALGLATWVAWPPRRLVRRDALLPFTVGVAGALAFFLIAKYGQPGHLETLEREGRSYLDFSGDLLRGPQTFAPFFSHGHRLPFTVLAAVGLFWLFRPWNRRSPLTYLYVVGGALIVLVVLLAGATWERERYLFFLLPLFFLLAGESAAHFLEWVPLRRTLRVWQPGFLCLAVALWGGVTGTPGAYSQEWGYDQAFRFLQRQWQPAAGDRIATPMSTAAMLYLGRNDAFAIQQGYEEYLVSRPGDGMAVDLWTATPVLTTTTAFTHLLASSPRLWFVVDGWRFQTRFQADFILTVLNQMELAYHERGVMVFRGEGNAPPPEPAIKVERRAEFGGELALVGLGLSSARPAPGDELEVVLYWQALDQAGPSYTAFVHLVDAEGHGVAGVDEPVLGGLYQPDLWPQGTTMPDRHRLSLPPDLPPGRYRLDLGLYYPGQADRPLSVSGRDRFPLASLTVGEGSAPLSPASPTEITFDHRLRLIGFEVTAAELPPTTYLLRLFWQVMAPMEQDYTVFVHVLNADGVRVTQHDAPPGDRSFPTSTWLPGDVILDLHPLELPAGEYRLLIGVYHQPTGQRLAASDATGRPLGDAVPLTTLVVGEKAP